MDRVGYDQKGLGTEAQFVRTAVFLLITLQADEHGPVGYIGDFTGGEGTGVEGGVSAVDLFDVGAEDVGRVGEGYFGARGGGLEEGQVPDVGPPPGQSFR